MNLRQGTLLQGGKYHYRIVKKLGQGTFGITYLATAKVKVVGALGELETTIQVAVKEFFMRDINGRKENTVTCGSQSGIYEDYKRKFAREAQNLCRLNHPHIVRVLEQFAANNTYYYAMEYCEGGSLDAQIAAKGGLGEKESISYLRQIGSALSYMHGKKMLHLDLKPGNIVLRNEGDAVLIDFGLSKQFDAKGKPETTTAVGHGTPGYAPLEQANWCEGKGLPVTMDVYAMGATLYKMLMGVAPPEASYVLNYPGCLAEDLKQRNINQRVVQVIVKAMSPQVKDRYQSIDQMLAALDASTSDISVSVSVEDERTLLDESLRASLVTPSASQSSARSSINRGAVGGASSHPEGKHQQVGGGPKRSAEQTPFSFKKFLWPLLACVVAVVASFGVWAYNHISAEEERREQYRNNSVAQSTRTINGREYVDLGLSVKWATCNVGASSPSDYGNYYAWGETRAKSSYTEETYKYYKNGKYVDIGKDISDTKYDAARVNWGGTWRMPTIEEFDELKEKCTWTWTTQGGHNGYRVTGPNGKSIFLPAAGYRYDTLDEAGSYGYYWSATPDGNSGLAYVFDFDSYSYNWDYSGRDTGRTVRPVSD